jgi:pyridoxamine 5'-phosphate oxidase
MKGGSSRMLTAEALGPDPLVAAARWLDEARVEAGMRNPDAACLATLHDGGGPDARMVLVKGVEERGLTFFTNYESAKGRALGRLPKAALTFYWDLLGRQLRVRGDVNRTSAEESDEYFRTRPVGSRIGAWASAQSQTIESREQLERQAEEFRARHSGGEIPRPAHWGGFVLRPQAIEFWQEGEDRLHDRIVYLREDEGWRVFRLSP